MFDHLIFLVHATRGGPGSLDKQSQNHNAFNWKYNLNVTEHYQLIQRQLHTPDVTSGVPAIFRDIPVEKGPQQSKWNCTGPGGCPAHSWADRSDSTLFQRALTLYRKRSWTPKKEEESVSFGGRGGADTRLDPCLTLLPSLDLSGSDQHPTLT